LHPEFGYDFVFVLSLSLSRANSFKYDVESARVK
jgi:hypothetical protein